MKSGDGVIAAELAALREAVGSLKELLVAAPTERLSYSFEEAGRLLGRHSRTISRMVKRNELETVTIGGTEMIPAVELRRITTPKATRATSRRPGKNEATGRAAKSEIEEMLKRKR